VPAASERPCQVAIALVHRDERWLVARRPRHAHLGDLWEFPGGKCESGEDPAHAALRELREECGVQATAEQTLEPVVQEYPDRLVRITPVICCWQAGEPEPLGAQTPRWVTLGEMRELQMPAANAEVIRRLERAWWVRGLR